MARARLFLLLVDGHLGLTGQGRAKNSVSFRAVLRYRTASCAHKLPRERVETMAERDSGGGDNLGIALVCKCAS